MTFRHALLALAVAAAVGRDGKADVANIQAADASQAPLRVPTELEHATGFVRLLERSGVPVQEVLHSHMEGMFEGVQSAAFIRTPLGVAEIVVLPGATDAEQISITYTRNPSTPVPHHYVLKGPRLRSEGQPMDAAYPLYFTLHQNWFIMTLEPCLDDVLKRALNQTNCRAGKSGCTRAG